MASPYFFALFQGVGYIVGTCVGRTVNITPIGYFDIGFGEYRVY